MCPIVVLLILFYLLSEMLPGFSSAHLTSFLFFFFFSVQSLSVSFVCFIIGLLEFSF